MAATTISRTWYDALVDDDGTGTTGTIIDKADFDAILDDIDALMANALTLGSTLTVEGGKINVTGSFSGASASMSFTPTLTPGLNTSGATLYVAGTIVEHSSGTHPVFASARFEAPTVTSGAATLTEAATVYVTAAPTGGASNYAVHVAAGISRFDGVVYVADGTVGAPSLSFSSDTDTGLYRVGANEFAAAVNGDEVASFSSNGITLAGKSLVFSAADAFTGDVFLRRLAANALILRNGTNANSFRLSRTYTDDSNYQRLAIAWSGDNPIISTERDGTGAAATLILRGNAVQLVSAEGTHSWTMDSSGHLTASGVFNVSTAGTYTVTGTRTGGFKIVEQTVDAGFIGSEATWIGSGSSAHLAIAGYSSKDIRFFVNGTSTVVGKFEAATGDFFTNDGTVSSLSDRRLKRRVAGFTRGLAEIARLRPAVYRYRNDVKGFSPMTKRRFVSAIAQEVSAAIPEAARQGGDGYWAIADGPIVWALVNAVREIGERLDKLDGASRPTRRALYGGRN